MTKKLHKLAPEIQRRLLSGGAPRTMEPVLRDAWASLYRWHEEGEHVYRIRKDARALDVQLNLELPRSQHTVRSASNRY
jgi:hypothetical protein